MRKSRSGRSRATDASDAAESPTRGDATHHRSAAETDVADRLPPTDPMPGPSAGHRIVSVSGRQDDLALKGSRDARRLDQKIREAIRKDIRKYIGEQALVTGAGKDKVHIPIRTLELPEFRFDDDGSSGVGGAPGPAGSARRELRPGEKVEQAGAGPGAGEQEGEHAYEREVTLDELVEMALDELGLPNLDEQVRARIQVERAHVRDLRRTGPTSRVDMRRSLQANLLRNARESGRARIGGFHRTDLRHRSFRNEPEESSNAVIVSMMDVSGSMTEHKKYLVRMCLFWIKLYLERIYGDLEFLFIIHDTRAQVVDEERFFHTTTGGGTYISSAYRLAHDIVLRDYPPESWNIYPFYFSDGENWEDDNHRAVEEARKLANLSRMFYYGQVASTNYATFMKTITKGLADDPRLVVTDVKDEEDIAEAIRRFLAKDRELAGATTANGAAKTRRKPQRSAARGGARAAPTAKRDTGPQRTERGQLGRAS